jgi:hypothetical protein
MYRQLEKALARNFVAIEQAAISWFVADILTTI